MFAQLNKEVVVNDYSTRRSCPSSVSLLLNTPVSFTNKYRVVHILSMRQIKALF